MRDYYLYRHIRLDKNEPFYIGIGVKPKYYNGPINEYVRANSRWKGKRSNFWDKIVNKTKYEVEIVYETQSIDEVKSKEVEFISLYGRIDLKTGTLVNLTGGGDGLYAASPDTIERIRQSSIGRQPTLGMKFSEETKEKMRKAQTGKKLSADHKEKIRQALKGNKNCVGVKATPERVAKIKNALTGRKRPDLAGRKLSDETKKKIGIANKGRKTALGRSPSEETRKKIGLAHKGKKYNLGKKMSEQAKINLSNARKGIIFSEEHRKNLSEARKIHHSNHVHPMLGKKHSPESKLKMSLNRKKK